MPDNQGGQEQSSDRGFAAMDPDKQREIASKGGQSAPDEARSFSQDPELASEAGRKGGEASSSTPSQEVSSSTPSQDEGRGERPQEQGGLQAGQEGSPEARKDDTGGQSGDSAGNPGQLAQDGREGGRR